MTPVSFGQCFGWLHEGSSARGVVLLNPFGFEELCARKSYVMLAHALADRGIPTLRFDWAGTGDSLGGPGDPAQLETWRMNLNEAIETLKRYTGVNEIVLVGMRLATCLGLEAAARRPDVTRVIMLAPPASGKSWLRETATFGKMMAVPGGGAANFTGMEAAGFRFSEETCEAIRALDWSAIPALAGRRADIYMPAPLESANKLQATLTALGASAIVHEFPGYAAMMCDPTASEAPVALIVELATDLASNAPAPRKLPPAPAFSPLFGHGFSEAPARIDSPAGAEMAGILCHPLENMGRSEAVIFLNAGAIHHTGWGRMYVDLSRRLARNGVASLRLDLPGLGDSSRPGDPPVASLYARKMTAEVAAAITWLKARGYRRITLAGLCSGAFQAFHAAASDDRVDAVALVNQLCFVWGKSYALQVSAWQATKSRSMQSQAGPMDDMAAANRALAALMPMARKIAKSSLSALMSLQAIASQTLTREKPVEAAFTRLSARGARVLLAFSEGDASLAELERHMGEGGNRAIALPGVEKFVIPNADHMLTPMRAREIFGDRLVAFLENTRDSQDMPARASVAEAA